MIAAFMAVTSCKHISTSTDSRVHLASVQAYQHGNTISFHLCALSAVRALLPPPRWSDVICWVRAMAPATVWRGMTPDFYLLFWGLTVADLAVPKQRYDAEVAKLKAAMRSLEDITDTAGSAIQVGGFATQLSG